MTKKKTTRPRKPRTLQEAVKILIAQMDDRTKFQWKTHTFLECMAPIHFSGAVNLRNEWGLWDNKTAISKWLRDHGIHHGDDRSEVIFQAVWRTLSDMPVDDAWLAERKDFFDKWWSKENNHVENTHEEGGREVSSEQGSGHPALDGAKETPIPSGLGSGGDPGDRGGLAGGDVDHSGSQSGGLPDAGPGGDGPASGYVRGVLGKSAMFAAGAFITSSIWSIFHPAAFAVQMILGIALLVAGLKLED